MTCPDDAVLAALQDGELSINQAARVRQHASACSDCKARIAELSEIAAVLSAPVPGALRGSATSFADDVLARIDRPRARPARAIASWWMLAAAAVVVLGVGAGVRSERRDEWAARGGATTSPVKRTLLRFGRISGTTFEPITSGARIPGDSLLAVEASGVDTKLFLLAFLVDAAGDRHWIYPSYDEGAPHPLSVALPQTPTPRVLDSMTRPSEPAHGPGRLVAIVLSAPESVDFVESASPLSLTREALEAHYAGSLVISTDVEIP